MLPARIYAGASWEVTYANASYPAGDGWTSKLVLRNRESQATQEVNATADGDGFELAVAAGTTSAWAPGTYDGYIEFSKGTERIVCSPETVHILPDPGGAVVDTALKTELAAVDEAIAGVLAGKGVSSYTFETAVGRRSAQRMSLEELRKHREYLLQKIEEQEARAFGRQNRRGWRQISTRFDR